MRLSIYNIADLAGTSASTVSLVLNKKDSGRVSAKTREKILAIVRQQGYRQRHTARGLKLGKTFHVGFCFDGTLEQNPIIGHFSTYDLLRYAVSSLSQAGYGVKLLQTDKTESLPDRARYLAEAQLDGLLLLNWEPEAQNRVLFSLAERRIPAVSASVIDAADGDGCSVAVDNPASIRLAIKYLLEKNCRFIALLEVNSSASLNMLKSDAYHAVAREHGFPGIVAPVGVNPTYAMITSTVQDLLREHPQTDGIVLTDNSVAAAVQQATGDHPVRLVGYGDAGFPEVMCNPPIPYMRMPIQIIANTAVQLLVERMVSKADMPPCQRLFPCELVGLNGDRPPRSD
jgi:DNA-binding LacI/PurR family transcriptional regulator